jgi:DnaJ domain
LMSQDDPKGYYSQLGVAPSASAEAIKAAYRQLAKKLHPDIDRDAGAKARFQAVNAAYSTLSNPELRGAYDALRYANPAPLARDHKEEVEPICCSRCGKITAQPRSLVFYRVVSLILVTMRHPVQGIFCSACAHRTALYASFVSAVVGWWGFPWGPIWTIGSIFNNASGGKNSSAVEEKLIWYNALAFLSKGKLAISYALAQQSRRAEDSQIAISALKLIEYLQAAGVPATSRALKNPWGPRARTWLMHLGLLIVVPGTICVAIWQDEIQKKISNDTSVASPLLQKSPSAAPTAVPTRAQEKAQIPKCVFPPENGAVLTDNLRSKQKGHGLEIRNGTGGNAIVKVRDGNTGYLFASFYVAKGSVASFDNLPDGIYRFQYAFGDDLRADCRNFVQTTSASQFPDIETLHTQRTQNQIQRSRLSYTLYSVPSGNVRPETLDVAKFNAD